MDNMLSTTTGHRFLTNDSNSSRAIDIRIRGYYTWEVRNSRRSRIGFDYPISYDIHDYKDYEDFVDAIISNDLKRVDHHIKQEKHLCHQGLLLTACFNTYDNKIAEFLIENGADLNFASNQKYSALAVALVTFNHNLVEMILDKISYDDINNKDILKSQLKNILRNRFCPLARKIYLAFIDSGFNILLGKHVFERCEESLNDSGGSFLTSHEFEGIPKEQFIAVTRYKLGEAKFPLVNVLGTIAIFLCLFLCLEATMSFIPFIVPIITSTLGITKTTFELGMFIIGISSIIGGFYLYNVIYNNAYIRSMNNHYSSLYEPARKFCNENGIAIDDKGNYISQSDSSDATPNNTNNFN